MLRFDRGNCGTKILNGLEAGDLKVEVSDFTNLYNLESIFWDKSICKSWQQALYMQWRHQNPDVSKATYLGIDFYRAIGTGFTSHRKISTKTCFT